MSITVRRAEQGDCEAVLRLLAQVNLIHHQARPDLFCAATKYDGGQLKQIFSDDARPVLVADDGGEIKGYAFCALQSGGGMMTPVKTLYLDDLCVDEKCRGQGIGKLLFGEVKRLARERGCYNITLNVWTLNPHAVAFYEGLGMKPLKICMESIVGEIK